MDNSKIHALVVDDSALYRKFVSSVLDEIPGVEVVGTASNGRLGLEKIKSLKPDLVTLDLEMPELDGLGLLRELSVEGIDVATIMISSMTDQGAKSTNTALQLGAFDFVLKPTGKGPEESRAQLRTDLAPKIEAYLVKLRSRRTARQMAEVAHSTSKVDPIKSMAERVKAMRERPEIVCIGVSTGGPVALNRVLPKLPADFPCPILLVQHMPPKFTKNLAEDLDRLCSLKAVEAVDGMVARPGTVLIAPGGSQMRIAKIGGLPIVQITDDPPERNCKPSVDYLFRSVAQHYGDRAVAAILTGMGDDGTQGCKLLKQRGAFVLAQDEASCVVYGMPKNVYDAGVVNHVASLSDMADCLVEAAGRGALA